MKRRTGKFKKVDEYNKSGRDFIEIVINYKKFTTPFELKLFLWVPFIISTLVFAYFWFFEESNSNLLKYIMDMNKDVLSVIAILAGFNTTSLSIIAASNNRVLKFLKQHTVNDSKDTILKQLVSFFSFAILMQLIVLIVGILLSVVSKSFNDISEMIPILSGYIVKIPLTILGTIWLGIILFTIMISIRNATLLYRYVLFIANYDEKN